MSSLQIVPYMTNPPTHRATEPADGRFSSTYLNYFSFSDAGTVPIEQGGPPDLTNTGHVYTDNNLIDVGGHFVPREAAKGFNNFVPLGAQVAWDQGATTSNSVHDAVAMTSPMSQCVPMPLMPGISSFGPVLDAWSMPATQTRRPSASKPTHEQPQSKRRKPSASGKKKDENDRKTSTVTNLALFPPENATVSPKDSIAAMPRSSVGQPSTSSNISADLDHEGDNGYPQTQPQSPPQEASSGLRSANQRARNRVAANKFRRKSKAAIAELEAVERALSAQHDQLLAMVRDLREEVLGLKNELLTHGNCSCVMIHQYLSNTAKSLSIGNGTTAHNASRASLPLGTPPSDGSSSSQGTQ